MSHETYFPDPPFVGQARFSTDGAGEWWLLAGPKTASGWDAMPR